MNERTNRKVLISVKVSTLLIILLSIIIVTVLTKVIVNKLSNKSDVANVNNVENIDDTKESEFIEENLATTEEISERITSSEISFRSSYSRAHENKIEEAIGTQQENEEVQEEPIVEEIVTTPIEEVKISKDMDLTIRTGLSKEDFIILISEVKQDTSNFFEENAELIYDLCEKYELNEIFFCGLISAESGWNIASNHRRTHNYISLMSNNGLIKFASVEDGLEKAAKTLHDKYLTPGGCFYYGSTLAGMKTRFCPASSSWVNLVYQRMEQIMK